MSNQDNDRKVRDIENLVEIFNQSDWEEMHLKTDDLEIFLSNDPNANLIANVTAAPASAPVAATPSATAAAVVEPVAQETSPTKQVEVPEGMIAVTAPNLGTFYRAPKPGAAPYVETGQSVESNTDVCLIEVMKLFTPVKAGSDGKVYEICVEDGTMVEFGDVLVIIEPS
ncbi:MAG: acetyl-CoA carboxylase biotin carboxyl carrier protein [Pseudomonadota bacterium]